jgi:hypothetical protein
VRFMWTHATTANSGPSVWGIVGLGWLGQAFAKELQSHQQNFWGTHRSDFNFETDPFPQMACDYLLVNTPPLNSLSTGDYVGKIILGESSRLFFVSSTSVYSANQGVVTESTPPSCGDGASAKWLSEVENRLRDRFEKQLTIVRPGGLIGGQRHPVFYLGGRSGLPGGLDPVNLIHRKDLIAILMALTQHPEVLLVNAVAPAHPSKSEYYGLWAQKLGLPVPGYLATSTSTRRVDSDVTHTLIDSWHCAMLDRLD